MTKESETSLVSYGLRSFANEETLQDLLRHHADRIRDSLFGHKHLPALHYTARCGNFEATKFIIANDLAPINELDNDRNTALHYIVNHKTLKENASDMAQYLIRKGIRVRQVNSAGKTALANAAAYNHHSLLRYLAKDSDGTLINDRNNRPIIDVIGTDGNSLLHNAIKKGHSNTAKELVRLGANLTVTNAQNLTALAIAVKHNYASLFRVLSQNTGGNLINDSLNQPLIDAIYGATSGNTLLHFTVANGNLEAARELVRLGANAKLTNLAGQTALDIAVLNNQRDLLQILSQKEDGTLITNANGVALINAVDANGNTPMHLALMAGNLQVAEELLRLGADYKINNAQNHEPLYYLAKKWEEAAKPTNIGSSADLIKSYNKLVNQFLSKDGNFFLSCNATKLIIKNMKNICRLVLAPPPVVVVAAPSSNNSFNRQLPDEDASLLRLTMQPSSTPITQLQMVFSRRATSRVNLFASCASGRNALHNAVSAGNLAMIRYLIEEQHFNIHQQDYRGNSVLAYISNINTKSNFVDVLKYLVSKGATNQTPNQFGQLPSSSLSPEQLTWFEAEYNVEIARQQLLHNPLAIPVLQRSVAEHASTNLSVQQPSSVHMSYTHVSTSHSTTNSSSLISHHSSVTSSILSSPVSVELNEDDMKLVQNTVERDRSFVSRLSPRRETRDRSHTSTLISSKHSRSLNNSEESDHEDGDGKEKDAKRHCHKVDESRSLNVQGEARQ